MKYFLILLVFIFNYSFSQTPTLEWVNDYYSCQDYRPFDIDVDNNGNSYVTGMLRTSPTLEVAFLSKIDNNGVEIWSTTFPGTAQPTSDNLIKSGYNVSIDLNGNIILIGIYKGTVDMDPSSSVFSLTSTSPTLHSSFILKLDPNGNFIWAASVDIGILTNDIYQHVKNTKLVVDGNNDYIITGLAAPTTDYDFGNSILEIDSISQFIMKIDSDMNLLWAKGWVYYSNETNFQSLAVDLNNNIYLNGQFFGQTDFDLSANIFEMSSSFNTDSWLDVGDAFLLKLNSQGDFIWVKQTCFDCHEAHYGKQLVVDSSNMIYTTGMHEGVSNFDYNNSNYTLTSYHNSNPTRAMYLQKVDSDGNFIWVKQFEQQGLYGEQGMSSMALDSEANLYFTGYFGNSVDFDPSSNNALLTTQSSDIFLLKLDSSGTHQWSFKIDDETWNSMSKGDAISFKNDNIYTSGVWTDNSDFDPSTNNVEVSSPCNDGGYVAKYSQSTVASGISNQNNEYLSLFPIPTSGILHVNILEKGSVRVFDCSGKVLLSKQINNNDILDVTSLSNGVYQVQLITKNHISTRKIVISK